MTHIKINNRQIGFKRPVYIIAEMSANHQQDFNKAVDILNAAKAAGADAVKLQTYTPDTMTIDSRAPHFRLTETIWKGQTLYDLYRTAYTPWHWQPQLMKKASELGLDLFSTPFDNTAVDFLETMNVPAYKVASFELIDIPLLKAIAQTGKPVILSTGMASLSEIEEAVVTLKTLGCNQIALLKCTSAYPASPEEANLRTIPHLAQTFDAVCGISDHTLGSTVAIGAVAMGACIVEKHLTLSRADNSPDSAFSMEPHEFKSMVDQIRILEQALGAVTYDLTSRQKSSLMFRRSLFVVKDIEKAEPFTPENIRCIRPGFGLHPRYYGDIMDKKAATPLTRGTPLAWEMIV
nr:pseudaminic acid synthase [uncultured Desulfobacter sp.]